MAPVARRTRRGGRARRGACRRCRPDARGSVRTPSRRAGACRYDDRQRASRPAAVATRAVAVGAARSTARAQPACRARSRQERRRRWRRIAAGPSVVPANAGLRAPRRPCRRQLSRQRVAASAAAAVNAASRSPRCCSSSWSSLAATGRSSAAAHTAASALRRRNGQSPLELVSLRHERHGATLASPAWCAIRPAARGRPADRRRVPVRSAGRLHQQRTRRRRLHALAPGDESPFVIAVEAPSNVARYRVSFRTERASCRTSIGAARSRRADAP